MVADASSPNLVLKAWEIPSWLLVFYPCWTMETLGLTSEESGSSCRTGHPRQQGGNEGKRADRSSSDLSTSGAPPPKGAVHLEESLLPSYNLSWKCLPDPPRGMSLGSRETHPQRHSNRASHELDEVLSSCSCA